MRDETAAKLRPAWKNSLNLKRKRFACVILKGSPLKQISERIQKSEMAVAGLLKRGLQNLRLDFAR